ncbi:MAG: ISNCY family transposase, partial [Gammaproteobacteria bacterium]|nr:ISNCY family transposase [Gammaproteobacteria bacterium]
LTTTRQDGKVIYRNAFATNHTITAANVAEVVRAGRARWKVENENNNTLKTKGYHLSHNFGHGKQHLSALLASLNLLAFLFHTLLDLFDSSYQCIRQFLPRKTFFDDLRALTRYLCFDSWEALMAFMIKGLELKPPDTS